jgi:hypothetical protein
VILFADVCGFSALTRWLAEHYEQGPWATGRVLNTLFRGLVACVQARAPPYRCACRPSIDARRSRRLLPSPAPPPTQLLLPFTHHVAVD